jgi:hypothetical protein
MAVDMDGCERLVDGRKVVMKVGEDATGISSFKVDDDVDETDKRLVDELVYSMLFGCFFRNIIAYYCYRFVC